MLGLQGLRVIVAGSATGIGAAVVRRFAQEGAKIIAGDVNFSGAQHLAKDNSGGANSGSVVPFEFDLANESSIESLVEASVREHGGVDALVNVAAAVGKDFQAQDVAIAAGVNSDIWNETLNTNLTGYALTTAAVLPHMLAQQRGSIVNISSAAARIPGLQGRHPRPHPPHGHDAGCEQHSGELRR